MARYHAIAATSNAIRLLLENASTSSEWAGHDFPVVQAEDLQKPLEGATKPKLSIYLYRVVPATARRERPPVGPDGPHDRPSIPLDLHYLVTAWSAVATTAQQLLGWAIRVLDDTPVIPTSMLNAYQAGLTVFAPDERVDLAWNPLTPTELSDIWQVAPQSQSPSASYVARGVVLRD